MIHNALGVILSGAKAFWSATVQVVWGFVSFFLLAYFLPEEVASQSLIDLFEIILFLQENWMWFWWAFVIFELILNLKQFIKVEVEVETKTAKKQEVKL